ncbi:hypothetical protein [Marivita sp. GX14005]|uniref:hypothetical protein n=1 Tax=Marivita sp. GX14005 TaxID=2942276 RepID=UPI0020196800|nr:hypothetical protein [Marivita sp. GX14005]MCL3882685.1 hypothetical protein [Marivita sp. GX14005]
MPRLTVEAADETAEIFVVASHFALAERGVRRLERELPAGIYKVRAVSARSEWQKVIALRGDTDISIPPIEFGSAAPLALTNRTHETHMAAAEDAAPPPPPAPEIAEAALRRPGARPAAEHTASFNFMARWWTPYYDVDPKGFADPSIGASLRSGGGRRLLNLWRQDEAQGTATNAGPRISGEASWFAGDLDEDRFSGVSFNAAAGLYTLSLSDGDGTIEQTVTLLPGWRTHVFALYEPDTDAFGHPREDGGKRLVDLSIHIARGKLEMGSEVARITDAARFALADERSTATQELLGIVRGKSDAPMLGLYGAHLMQLLKDKTSTASVARSVDYDPGLFEEVAQNTADLFGRNHPDIVALLGPEPGAKAQVVPPMLWRGWTALLERSLDAPALVSPPMWRRTALRSHSRPFFAWRTPQYAGTATMMRDIELTRSVLQFAGETAALEPDFAGLLDGTVPDTRRREFTRRCITRFEAPRSVIDMVLG